MDFYTALDKDKKITELAGKVKETGDMEALSDIAALVGEVAAQVIESNLPQGTLTEQTVRPVVSEALKQSHRYITGMAAQAIDYMYGELGLGVKGMKPEYRTDLENEIVTAILEGGTDDGTTNADDNE